MHPHTLLALASLLAAAAPLSAASAQPLAPAAQVEASASDSPDFAITISPVHLILPVVEATGEYRVSDRLGAALVLGYGEDVIFDDITLWEAGAQLRWYALGSFAHGMQLGAELMALYGYARDDGDGTRDTASGLTVGPFAGYKYTAGVGLTVEVQAGAQYVAVRDGDDMSDLDDEDDESSFGPLVNLNLGWSF